MRIVHLADTHLGARRFHYTDERGRNLREQDIYRSFKAAIETILELRPTLVIHAGDLFDGYHPSAAALGVALDEFARLRRADIEVVVVAGNHSTPRSAAIEHPFAILERFGVHAVHGEPRRLSFGDLALLAVPHCRDETMLATWIAGAEPDTAARYNVLTTHVGLTGLGRVGAGEAGSVELSGEVLEESGSFDYIALGHLHQFDRVRLNAAYAGSLERLSWADRAKEKKGFIEVDLAVDPLHESFLKRHSVPTRPQIVLPPVESDESEDLETAICATAEASEIEGAIVKLPIRGVSLAAFGALNRREINAAFASCLHLELEPEFEDPIIAGAEAPRPQDLRDFLAQRKPKGVEMDAFVERAESFLTRAAEELGA